jgi:hypothetical protein
VRLELERLERRDVPAPIVAKSMELTSSGQLYIDGQPWQGGAQYSTNVQFEANAIIRLNADGVLIKAGTTYSWSGVQDFTLGKNGSLWIQYQSGELDAQVNALSAWYPMKPMQYNLTYMAANFDGTGYISGDIWAVDSTGQLKDYQTSSTVPSTSKYGHDYSNAILSSIGVDFTFNGKGNAYVLDTSGNLTFYNAYVDPTLNNPWTQKMRNATLAEDWQNPYGSGINGAVVVYVNYSASGPSELFLGNGYHGMVVYGTLE